MLRIYCLGQFRVEVDASRSQFLPGRRNPCLPTWRYILDWFTGAKNWPVFCGPIQATKMRAPIYARLCGTFAKPSKRPAPPGSII
jgi:hypothetical protein